jgi:hypothetical protein
LLTLAAGVVLGTVLNSRSCDEPVCAAPPQVVYETPEPRVVYVPAPRTQTVIYVPAAPVCNSAPVTVQQTVVNNNDLLPTPSPSEPTCAITGHVKLVGFCHTTSICIPANKPVSEGTEIWFICDNQVVGKFSVTEVDVDQSTVTVKLLCGSEPANGTGFAIVYP